MAFGNSATDGAGTAENKFSFTFYKGKADEKPYFKVKRFAPEAVELENCSEIKGTLKGVFYNKSDKPEYSDEIKVLLHDAELDEMYYVSFRVNSVVIPMINSLLAVEKGTEIRIATYVNKDGYKNIAVFNPNKKVEITTKDGKEITVDESFRWVFKKEDLPQVTVTKNKQGKVVDVDDAELNAFFAKQIEDVFGESKDEAKVTEPKADGDINPEDIPF